MTEVTQDNVQAYERVAVELSRIPDTFGGLPVRKVSDLESFVKALIYGMPGSGKTTLAASASKVPAMSPVLHLSTDHAESETLHEAAPDVHVQHLTKFEQFWKIRDDMIAACQKPAGPPFKTVIIDTGTEAQKTSMTDIMTKLVETGRPGGGSVDLDVPSQREWGQSISEMRRLVRGFRDLPIHFIMTCHMAESRDNTGVTWKKPDLPGKLANQICGMFSNVLYLYVKEMLEREEGSNTTVVKEELRVALTGLTVGYLAKSRTGVLPRAMPNPDMATLYRLITGKAEGV